MDIERKNSRPTPSGWGAWIEGFQILKNQQLRHPNRRVLGKTCFFGKIWMSLLKASASGDLSETKAGVGEVVLRSIWIGSLGGKVVGFG